MSFLQHWYRDFTSYFYECNVTRNIWILLQKWLENRNIFMSISKQAFIFNISNNGQGIDTIILVLPNFIG